MKNEGMKNKKTLHIIIAALTIALIGCIYLLNKKERQKNNFIRDTTLLLSKLTDMISTDIDETLGEYDFLYEWIKEDLDSFYIYSKYNPVYNSKQFKDYFKKRTYYDMEWFNVIKSTYNPQSIEYEFYKKLVDFVFITRLQRRKLMNFCLFDGVGVGVFSKKDTISKGEEYLATIEYQPTFFQTIPIMIINGDTVPTTRNIQVFREIPQKSGQVKHECTITFNQQGHHLAIPFTIEYYVK